MSKEAPIIHEAITLSPDPTEFMPVEVNSAFPEGAASTLTTEEKTMVDRLIEAVPDENDVFAINYWRDMGDKRVYLEGWCDKCLAGTGFPTIGRGEWDEKIQYMVRDTHRTLIRKQRREELPLWLAQKEERGLTLIEGGFREFEAGDRDWLYGVTWGVYFSTGEIKEAGSMAISEAVIGAVAAKAAVSAATLVGQKISEEIAKRQEEESLHSSPISIHCERVLETSPKCWDFRGIRSYVMCRAWQILEEEKRTRLPVGEAWMEARKVCVME